MIYNLGKIDLSEFDRFYTNITGEDETFESSSRVGEGLASSGVGLARNAASGVGSVVGGQSNLGVDEIDPYDPNLFKDEIIDIDFGAIDAYTAGLNAQINAEKANNPREGQLQFPSHILTSNHATFIDNQMLLSDPFYAQSTPNAPQSGSNPNAGGLPHESASNLNGNNQNGVSFE